MWIFGVSLTDWVHLRILSPLDSCPYLKSQWSSVPWTFPRFDRFDRSCYMFQPFPCTLATYHWNIVFSSSSDKLRYYLQYWAPVIRIKERLRCCICVFCIYWTNSSGFKASFTKSSDLHIVVVVWSAVGRIAVFTDQFLHDIDSARFIATSKKSIMVQMMIPARTKSTWSVITC